jgi:FkbM family methyltransferase
MAKLWYYLKSIFELLCGFREPFKLIKIFLGSEAPRKQIVQLRSPALKLAVRGKMDIWSVKETFIDRFYTRYGCDPGKGWTIVDIGAAIGEFSLFTAAHDPSARIYAYEPFPESVAIFRENIAANGIRNITLIPKAVWKSDTTLQLDLSLLEPLQITSNETGGNKTRHDKVQAISLQEVLRSNQLKSVDLLKLDCEGAEFDILLGSEPEIVKKFKRIVMEYHDAPPGRHHSQLVTHLEGLGYRVTARRNVVHPLIGYLYVELVR